MSVPTDIHDIADGLVARSDALRAVADGLTGDVDALRDLAGQWDPAARIEELEAALAAALADAAACEAELATVAGERDAWQAQVEGLLVQVTGLEAQVDALTEALAECEGGGGNGGGPSPEPIIRELLTGPVGLTPGPLANVPDGSANRTAALHTAFTRDGVVAGILTNHKAPVEALTPERIRVTLGPDPTDGGAATAWLEGSLFTPDVPAMSFETTLRFVDSAEYPFAWSLTGKVGGPMCFDDTWDGDFPAGGTWGPENASCRLVWGRGSDGQGRLGLYLYLGTDRAGDIAMIPSQVYGTPFDWTGTGHVMHFTSLFVPESNVDYRCTVQVRMGTVGGSDGSARLFVDGDCVLDLDGVPWVESGRGLWSRSYLSVMCGGSSPEYLPPNAKQAIQVELENIVVGELVA